MALNVLHANDRQGQYPPSWYAATVQLPEAQPPLEGTQRADVCVIGGGYTGLSAALHLAEAGYSVVLLEAHRVGWGASGRNGGQVGTGQRRDQDQLEERLGLDTARQLWELAEESKALVAGLIERFAIECEVAPGIIHADHKPRYVAHSKAYAEKLNTRYGYDRIRFVGRDEIRSMIGSDDYHGGTYDAGAFHIHPLKYALGLARAAREAGVRIFENSEVTATGRAGKASVTAAGGLVECDHIVLACNGYLGGLEPRAAARVMPINNFVIATEPLTAAQREAIMPTVAAVADSKFVINYFRMTHDNRLLFGGGENYGYRFPADIKAFVRKPMLEIFPQSEPLKIDYGWGGTLAVTVKRMPLFQRIAGNILTCTGYSGHGVALATLAGKIAAEAINGQASRFDLMAEMDTPRFPGGTLLRYPMLVAAMTWFSLRDRL